VNSATFGIAVLLAAGIFCAKVAQRLRLPSVTGFILAGLALGPSGFGLLSAETVGHQLDHFTQIALMLIAFGIGEHIELRRLGEVARDVVWIAVVQALAAFVLVSAAALVTTRMVAGGTPLADDLVLALLLGAVAVATAPAAILHVVREMGARGPLTATLMAVVAVDDGLAIMIFGMAVAVSHQLAGSSGSALGAVAASLSELTLSLVIGTLTGLLIDWILPRLHRRGEMLTGGLALLLICGEVTRMLHLSPLLAGMMAGFIIINRAERDVRLFRAINSFEPPIYVLFFTLAGVHLDLGALRLAGWLGLVYFLARIAGKVLGTWLGGLLSGASALVRNYLGLALIPQAGVAIGLVFMIASDARLNRWSAVITPIVLAGVVLSELIGPLLVRLTLEKGGEGSRGEEKRTVAGGSSGDRWRKSGQEMRLPPWNAEPLHPSAHSRGLVVFGVSHAATARGLARIATIMAHHFHGRPLGVRVLPKGSRGRLDELERQRLFRPEREETESLGYSLNEELVYDEPASGLVAAAEYNQALAVILGYPLGRNPLAFQKVLDRVASHVLCPVLAVRFVGVFRCRRILVPFLFPRELDELAPVCDALAGVGHSRITLLQILHADCGPDEMDGCRERLEGWLKTHLVECETRIRVEAADSRLEVILDAAHGQDLIVMTASRRSRLGRVFFGSLAGSVVHNCANSVIVVHTPEQVQAHDGMS